MPQMSLFVPMRLLKKRVEIQIGYTVDEFLEFFEEALKKVKIDCQLLQAGDMMSSEISQVRTASRQLVNKIRLWPLKGRVAGTDGINSALEALENANLVGLSTPLSRIQNLPWRFKKEMRSDIQLTVRRSAWGLSDSKAAFKISVQWTLRCLKKGTARGLRSNTRGERRVKDQSLNYGLVDEGKTAQKLFVAVELAQLQTSGFHRFWVSEHHNVPALSISAPEIGDSVPC